MYMISTSMVLYKGFISSRGCRSGSKICSRSAPICMYSSPPKRRHALRFTHNAKNRHPRKRRPWWQKFFSDQIDETWTDWSADDVLGESDGTDGNDGEEGVLEEEKFEAWKRKAEAISELREAQEDARNAEGREWENWIGDSDVNGSSWDQDWGERAELSSEGPNGPDEMMLEEGFVASIKNLIVRRDSDDLLFEDRVFLFASTSSAKFIALLVLIPWALDFLVHDYVLMPFLDRYVKTVPLASEILDVRKKQKLEMVKSLKIERARFLLEVEIGKSPPLSDDELWLELRHKAIELRDEWRLENRREFANIWSDIVYGIALFVLIYFNKSKVALLKFTGYKLLNNITDSGKAFLIILITDIFLGYHSESGWQALIEVILEHYGFEVDQAAITIFICFVPVVVDACVKLWIYKYLPRVSPNVTNIFREMKRH